MKLRKEKKNNMVKMVLVAMVLIFVLSSIPASAFELALATGDSPAKPSPIKIQKADPNAQPQQLLSKKSLKDLIELPNL